MIEDLRGVEIELGDRVAYGKSCRYDPIHIGTVKEITDKEIHILGDGNTKVGKLPLFHTKRIIVLPEDY